jgi:hypothetical protein
VSQGDRLSAVVLELGHADSAQQAARLLRDAGPDYLLVSQKAAIIEHFQRERDGSWRYRAVGPGQRVTLTQGVKLEVDAIFDGVFQLAAG